MAVAGIPWASTEPMPGSATGSIGAGTGCSTPAPASVARSISAAAATRTAGAGLHAERTRSRAGRPHRPWPAERSRGSGSRPAWAGATRSISSQMSSRLSKSRSTPRRAASSDAIIQSGPGHTGRRDLLAEAADPAFEVGERAGPLGVGRRRQDHVGPQQQFGNIRPGDSVFFVVAARRRIAFSTSRPCTTACVRSATQYLAPGGVVLFSDPFRSQSLPMLEAMEASGWSRVAGEVVDPGGDRCAFDRGVRGGAAAGRAALSAATLRLSDHLVRGCSTHAANSAGSPRRSS